MKVFLTQPRGKEKLVEAFANAGAEVEPLFKEGIDLIVPLVDEELWFFSRAKDWFEEKGIVVAVPSEFTVTTCRDKAEFYKFCKRHGYNTPDTAQFNAIIKPRFGKGSHGQFKVDRSYVIQEIVKAPEYSIDYYKDDNVLSIIPRLRLNILDGASQSGQIVMDERLIEEAKQLGKDLKLKYHNVLQCFYDGHTIKWLEVNCRYGGGSWMTFSTFNSPERLMKLVKERV